MTPINTANNAVMTITTEVEPISSWRLDQETLVNSTRTSFKKLIAFAMIFICRFIYGSRRDKSGAAGLEPAVTVLETVGLPLTDAPMSVFHLKEHLSLFYLFMRSM